MTEITDASEGNLKFRNLEAAYEQVLGFRFPENPASLPVQIVLPSQAAGGLIDAIVAQDLDDPQTRNAPRERSQVVGQLERNGVLRNSSVVIGTPKQTRDAHIELGRWFRPLAGKDPRAIHYWHTHTTEYRGIPSTSDVAQRIGEDRKALIYTVGAPDGITSIFQTKEAIPRYIPLSTFAKGFAAYDKLVWFYNSAEAIPDVSALAKFLEGEGYALYGWMKPHKNDTVRMAHERGDFSQGIRLNRIGDPLWLRLLRERL